MNERRTAEYYRVRGVAVVVTPEVERRWRGGLVAVVPLTAMMTAVVTVVLVVAAVTMLPGVMVR